MKFKRILHLSIDDLRFDSLSASPNKSYLNKYWLEKLPSTPNIDYFANNGVLFSKNYSTAPFTPPSHASMLTGTYQNKHFVRPFLGTQLSNSIKTIFEYLEEQDFHTISAVDFKDIFELNNLLRGSKETIIKDDEKVINALLNKKNENVYLFMHIGDVHPPYGESFYPPNKEYNESFYEDYELLAKELNINFESFRDSSGKINRADLITLSNQVRIYCEENMLSDVVQFPRYLNGINKFDRGRFKKFIDTLKTNSLLDSNTLLIITSDHGQTIINSDKTATSENKKKLMKFDHGETVIEEVLRVPLIFYSPSIKPTNNSLDTLTSVVDIVPTILDFLEIQNNNLDGASLKQIILGKERALDKEKRAIYAEAWFHDRKELSTYLKKASGLGHLPNEPYDTFLFQQTVITNDYKLVRTNQTEDSMEEKDQLFNISKDPHESFNLLKTLKLPRYNSSWDIIEAIYKDLKDKLSKYNTHLSENKDPHSVYKTKEEIQLIEERLAALGYIE